MSQHKIWNPRIFLLRFSAKGMDISHYIFVAALFWEISIIFLICHRFSMSQMIMTNYYESSVSKIRGKCFVPFNIFYHSMTDLKDSFNLSLSSPLNCVDLCMSITGRIVKFCLFHRFSSFLLFYLPVFHLNICSVRSQRFICRTDNLINIFQLF